MPTIQIQFPGGRYHATPPGSHVNEGHVEWPPSPWRLLRALLACGFNTQTWTSVPSTGRSLIEKLARAMPHYQLPRVSLAHSRHYMPIGILDGNGREKTSLIFDTWAEVSRDKLLVSWPCDLTEEELQLFDTLVRSLGYLGRSESWVEAKVVSDQDFSGNTYPCGIMDPPGHGWEQVHVLGPLSPEAYTEWQQRTTALLLADAPIPDAGVKPNSKAYKDRMKLRAKITEPFPSDLIDCLTKDNSWWKAQRWSAPPGSQPVLYWRPTKSMEISPPTKHRPPTNHTVSAFLLAMTTKSGNRGALPPVFRTLPQAELLHRQLVHAVTKDRPVNCAELTGCDDTGSPLKLPHQHAHILPLDLDQDKHIDHFLIFSPMGLGHEAQRAIRSVRRTFSKNAADGLQLAVAGVGDALGLLSSSQGRSLVTAATVWTSVTPMVLPRFLKKSGKNSLEGQVQAELQSRGLPRAESIQVMKDESISLRHFIRIRKRGSNRPIPPVDLGFSLRLTFSDPLVSSQLPLCLGYASHFGLGLFEGIE